MGRNKIKMMNYIFLKKKNASLAKYYTLFVLEIYVLKVTQDSFMEFTIQFKRVVSHLIKIVTKHVFR